jgi:hypothetical protein
MTAWKEFVTAAVIGTERGSPPTLPAALDPVVGADGELKPETRFLTRAGALALWRKAGYTPPSGDAVLAPAENEEAPLVKLNTTTHLRAVLSGRYAALLPELLSETSRLGLRLPPELLPVLLDRARQDRTLRPAVLAAGGQGCAQRSHRGDSTSSRSQKDHRHPTSKSRRNSTA